LAIDGHLPVFWPYVQCGCAETVPTSDLVTCYKIINGLLDIPFDTFF